MQKDRPAGWAAFLTKDQLMGRPAPNVQPANTTLVTTVSYQLSPYRVADRCDSTHRTTLPYLLWRADAYEYGEIEYGGLPVNSAVFVITLCCSAFQLWAACR
jgi:hypothetical protein